VILAGGNLSRDDVLAARPSVPGRVVYREFVQETVVLNLETGTYHGLNVSGGKMLQTLGAAPTVQDAAVTLAAYYGRPLTAIEDDLYRFCLSLLDRGLVELDVP
jgi:hypothetical protein